VACSLNLFGENNPKKAALRVEPHFPQPGVFEVKVCTQCGDCVAACPVEAIKKNDRGTYYVDFDECTLCLACIDVCPEGVMFSREGVDVVWKCDLCRDCVAVCGTDALWVAEEATA
jgi:ferredoxin